MKPEDIINSDVRINKAEFESGKDLTAKLFIRFLAQYLTEVYKNCFPDDEVWV